MELEKVIIEYIVGGIVLWNIWLSKKMFDFNSKINVNIALDKQTQKTLDELKEDIKHINESINKILAKLKINDSSS